MIRKMADGVRRSVFNREISDQRLGTPGIHLGGDQARPDHRLRRELLGSPPTRTRGFNNVLVRLTVVMRRLKSVRSANPFFNQKRGQEPKNAQFKIQHSEFSPPP